MPRKKSQIPTLLPPRFRRGFLWRIDRRSEICRELTGDLVELWTDLGGFENLSVQQRVLCERAVYLRRRIVDFEAAVMRGEPAPFDDGVYSNLCNVLTGTLKTLGLKRASRDVADLRSYLAGRAEKAAVATPTATPTPIDVDVAADADTRHSGSQEASA